MFYSVGQQLGNYRLQRFLGKGGFADVYLGEHVYLKTLAAIKVLRVQMERQHMQDFIKEAQLIAQLKHPHIVRVLEFGVENLTPFLVMDFVAGGSLREFHQSGVALPPAMIVPYVRQIGAALQYAHERRLIHRDVKPANMLIESNGEILLTDFGTAIIAHTTHSMSAQQAMGTMPYMAPEQIQAQARPASDQYALAISVYEWLTGSRPFLGVTSMEVAMKHLNAAPPPLRQKVPALSADIEMVVLTALAKDPRQRFGSVQAFANAFEQACSPPVIQLAEPAQQASLLQSKKIVSALGKLIFTLPSTLGSMISVQWSPDRKLIAAGGLHGLAVWEIATRSIILSLPVALHTVSWSLDNKSIGFISNQVLQIYNAVLGFALVSERIDRAKLLAWSPDGKVIAIGGSDGSIWIWDVHVKSSKLLTAGQGVAINALSWSPDNKYVVSGGDDAAVLVWDVSTGQQISAHSGHFKAIRAVVWSPDGKNIASAGDDTTIQVWDAPRGGNARVYSGHAAPVRSLSWSPSSVYLASASEDHTVRIWDSTAKRRIFKYEAYSGVVEAVAWSPNGKYIASAGNDSALHIWHAV